MTPFDDPPTSGDVREVRMNLRPDSDDDGCGYWTAGQPGTGVIFGILPDAWRPRAHYRIDSAGRPARYGLRSNGTHRATAPGDVPILRAHALSTRCEGDGHYECRRCIFFCGGSDR